MAELRVSFAVCWALALLFGSITAIAYAGATTYYTTAAPTVGVFSQAVLASSSNGTVLVAVATESYDTGSTVLISLNSGVTWLNATSPAASSDYYVQVAVNSTGQQITLASTGAIFISSNFGKTWQTATPKTQNVASWRSISTSSSGQYLVTCQNGGGVFVSNNYGSNWTLTHAPHFQDWSVVAVSGNGMYMIAATTNNYASYDDTYNGAVFMSSNYGATWAQIDALPALCYASATISSSGQYFTLSVCTDTTFWASNDYGETWGSSIPSGEWTAIAVSADGQYVLAASEYSGSGTALWLSSDGGALWTIAMQRPSDVSGFYQAAAMSHSGQYMVAGFYGGGWVYCSNDYGATWLAADNNNTALSYYYVSSLAMSSIGATVYAAVQNVGVLKSTNFGKNWTLSLNNNQQQWSTVACSSSGATVIAAATVDGYYNFLAQLGYVWVSTNAGVTWTVTPAPSGDYVSVAVSSNGMYLAAANSIPGFNASIWLSSDGGASWHEAVYAPPDQWWTAIAMSGNGMTLWATTDDGQAYNTTDFGQSWASQLGLSYSQQLNALGVNINGTSVFTGSDNGGQLITYRQGSLWQTGFANGATIVTLVAASLQPQNMVVTTQQGVYTSNSFGASWLLANMVGDQGLSFDYNGAAIDSYGKYSIVFNSYVDMVMSSNPAAYFNPLAPTLHPTHKPTAGAPTVPTASPSVRPTSSPTSPVANSPTTSPTTGVAYEVTFYETGSPDTIYMQASLIATSFSGSVTVAAAMYGLYVSSNYGSTWVNIVNAPTPPYTAVAINGTGELIIVSTSQQIFISATLGSSWTTAFSAASTSTWFSLSASSSGQYILAGQDNALYLSSNFGRNWSIASSQLPLGVVWKAIAVSSNGMYMYAGVQDGVYDDIIFHQLYMSSNYGVSWAAVNSITNECISSIIVSANGQQVSVVMCENYQLWQSSNFGKNWTLVSPVGFGGLSTTYNSIAGASNAPEYMIAGTDAGLFVSNTWGMFWTPAIVPTSASYWSSVAINAVGSIMVGFDLYTDTVFSSDAAAFTPTTDPTAFPTAVPTALPTSTAANISSASIYGAIIGTIGGAAILVGVGYYFLVVAPAAATIGATSASSAAAATAGGSSGTGMGSSATGVKNPVFELQNGIHDVL